jgi:hypothetical protein
VELIQLKILRDLLDFQGIDDCEFILRELVDAWFKNKLNEILIELDIFSDLINWHVVNNDWNNWLFELTLEYNISIHTIDKSEAISRE